MRPERASPSSSERRAHPPRPATRISLAKDGESRTESARDERHRSARRPFSARAPARWIAGLAAIVLVPAAVAAEAQEEAPEDRPWSTETELSLVETGGNSESTTFSMKNSFERRWTSSILTVDAAALRADSTERVLVNEGGEARSTEVDKVTAERYGVRVKYDREIDARLGWFAFGGWQRNQPAGIDDRYNLDAGASYAFLDGEQQSLVGEAGLGYTDEYPVVGPSESFATLRVLSHYERRVSATSTLETELEAIQNLDETDDLRINFLLGLTAKINTHLALKASYTLSHDDDPATRILPGDDPGELQAVFEFDQTDTVLAVSLVIDF